MKQGTMLLLREMQEEQKKCHEGREMACYRKVVGANLNLKGLSNYHQGALEQSSEAAL